MRAFVEFSLGILILLLITPGCGPSLSEEELGTVIYDLEQVPGADEPYLFPESPPESEAESALEPELASEPESKSEPEADSKPEGDSEPDSESEPERQPADDA